jgi:anti-sigma regulatory factor (Ser/Thr protein kinase)
VTARHAAPTRTLALPHDLSSPKLGRQLITTALAEWGADPHSGAADDLRLAASEAITNAVTHGAGPVELTLTYANSGESVTCRVRDHGTWVPADSADPEHGRGIKIIYALASWLEVDTRDDGTVILFAVNLPAQAAAGLAA